jgi:hypothetical protein
VFSGIACIACPWYFDWGYNNDPSILLVAATFLMLNKFWSNLISSVLSGFVITKGIYLINNFGWIQWLESLFRQWDSRKELELDILKIWEIQFILAIIVFSFLIFFLVRDIFNENISQNRFV